MFPIGPEQCRSDDSDPGEHIHNQGQLEDQSASEYDCGDGSDVGRKCGQGLHFGTDAVIGEKVDGQRRNNKVPEKNTDNKQKTRPKYHAATVPGLMFEKAWPDKTPEFPQNVGKRHHKTRYHRHHDVGRELSCHIDVLQRGHILTDAQQFGIRIKPGPVCGHVVRKFAQQTKGDEIGFFRGEDHRIEYKTLVYESENGQDKNGRYASYKMPPQYLEMFEEGHFSRLIFFVFFHFAEKECKYSHKNPWKIAAFYLSLEFSAPNLMSVFFVLLGEFLEFLQFV